MCVLFSSATMASLEHVAGSLKDVEGSPEWHTHVQQLADGGFFGEARIDSDVHKQLMQQAAERFRSTDAYRQHRSQTEQPGVHVQELLQQPHEFDPAQVASLLTLTCPKHLNPLLMVQ